MSGGVTPAEVAAALLSLNSTQVAAFLALAAPDQNDVATDVNVGRYRLRLPCMPPPAAACRAPPPLSPLHHPPPPLPPPFPSHASSLSSRPNARAGWTLQSGYLVFFMQAGFAMLSAGSVRAKNAKNIILLNLLDACFGAMAWYATGWAFAFGDPPQNADGSYPWAGNPFIGHKYFFQAGLPTTMMATWFFQFTFAATSATIVSGAVAERCKFQCYVAYNLMLVAFVYPVVSWQLAWAGCVCLGACLNCRGRPPSCCTHQRARGLSCGIVRGRQSIPRCRESLLNPTPFFPACLQVAHW